MLKEIRLWKINGFDLSMVFNLRNGLHLSAWAIDRLKFKKLPLGPLCLDAFRFWWAWFAPHAKQMAMDEKIISSLLDGRFKWCSLKMYGNFLDSCLEGEPNGILDKPLQPGFWTTHLCYFYHYLWIVSKKMKLEGTLVWLP